MNLRLSHTFLFAVLLALPPGSLFAQQFSTQTNAGQIERSRLPDPNLPVAPSALSEGQPPDASNTTDSLAPATRGDNDLGVQSLLRAPTRPQPWTVFADGGFVFTSNVALTKHHEQNDVLYVGEGGVGYDWTLLPNLKLSASVREQYFAYDRFSDLNFGSLGAAAGASYTVHQLGDLVVSAQFGYTRLTHQGITDNEFFRSGNLALGVQKLMTFGRAQLFTVGGDVDLGLSVPHVAEREEFGASVGYVVQITRHLSVQTGARLAYFLYASSSRQDFNGSGSAGLTYAFTPWCSLGATVSGTLDRSDRAVFDYNVLNSGVSAFFRLRF